MKPVVLAICDGWGVRRSRIKNAPRQARTPVVDDMLAAYPHAQLDASGEAVGLPPKYQGNSEVGHLTIGAGRPVYQALMRVNTAIRDGSFFKNNALYALMRHVKRRGSRLHVMGLVQDEGVHAHVDHLYALLRMAAEWGIEVIVHAFTDGRDTPPKSASKYLRRVERSFKRYGVGRFGVLVGRYYAMDRDKRWDRTERAYRAIAYGEGTQHKHWKAAIRSAYQGQETDEFVTPRVMEGYDGLREDDGIVFFNYRYDRARQITQALVEPRFKEFEARHPRIKMVALTEYYDEINCSVAFPPHHIKRLFGEVTSQAGLSQLRVSETEKYAHVTFFFNGLEETAYEGEDRVLIPSPKVATYDQQPEMSAQEIAEQVVENISEYDVIILNLVNGDMVGHTGDVQAAARGIEAVDSALGKIRDAVLGAGGCMLVTADHGNCEDMSGKNQTKHTTNRVRIIEVSNDPAPLKRREGTLADIAPTMLKLLGLRKPRDMHGKSLL